MGKGGAKHNTTQVATNAHPEMGAKLGQVTLGHNGCATFEGRARMVVGITAPILCGTRPFGAEWKDAQDHGHRPRR